MYPFLSRLWLETVNVLRPTETQVMQPLTHQNLTEDPLIVLRCDRRVFRYTELDTTNNMHPYRTLASYPGLLTPAFVASNEPIHFFGSQPEYY